MDKLKYIKLENPDGSYSESIPLSVDGNYIDINGDSLIEKLAEKASLSSVEAIQNKIIGLENGSPLVANSINEMTDISRTYVNTMDGNWYYYDGQNWVPGGIYQSTALDNKQITPDKLNNLNTYNLKNIFKYSNRTFEILENKGINPEGHWGTYNNFRTLHCRIPNNSYIRIKKNTTSDRFRISAVEEIPTDSIFPIIFDDATATEYTFYSGNNNYLYITYTSSNEEVNIDVEIVNKNKILDYISPENTSFMNCEYVDNLYNENCKIIGEGTQLESGYYQYRDDPTYKTYNFYLNPNETYNIIKIGGNKFRVCLWYWKPVKRQASMEDKDRYYKSHPSKVVIDDDDTTEISFNSENYLYCTILYSNDGTDATFEITSTSNKRYYIPNEFINNNLPALDPFTINNSSDNLSDVWTQWNARLAFGMNTENAPVPTLNNQQLLNKGTIITYNTGNQRFNRWGFHVFEAYDKNLYNRITLLLDKHLNELNKRVAELYYYTGASHAGSSYAWFRLGSDVKDHSFMFNRDEFVAYGVSDLRNVMTLARISPTNDLITTYETVADADAYYEPENYSIENAKCLLYIALKNAQNGSMFYDTDRNKIVVKVNNEWCDMNVTPVENNTYNF